MINGNASEGGDPTLFSRAQKGPKSLHPYCKIQPFAPPTWMKTKQLYSEHSLVCCVDMTEAVTWRLWLHKAHSVNCRSSYNSGPQACLWDCQSRWDVNGIS